MVWIEALASGCSITSLVVSCLSNDGWFVSVLSFASFSSDDDSSVWVLSAAFSSDDDLSVWVLSAAFSSADDLSVWVLSSAAFYYAYY